MNYDAVIDREENESALPEGFIKLYPYGKVGLLFDGPNAYRSVAEGCFRRALKVSITVDDIHFVRAMRSRGVPDDAINECLNSCLVFDEVHLGGLHVDYIVSQLRVGGIRFQLKKRKPRRLKL